MSHLTKEQLDTINLSELKLVDSRLQDILESHSLYLNNIAGPIFSLGGKRIRPLLVMLCSGIYRANLRARVDIAVAAELIHTASLIHDDVVDDAPMRRGQPSVNKQWGNPSSVLIGDFLFAKAFSILSSYNGALKIMTDAIATMCEGELIQLHAHFDPDITPETYVNTIAGKTASLLAASCECGGIISAMPSQQVHALRGFGLHLGIAYQIIDDIGDYVLGSSQSGKPRGNDLKHGIITLPLMYILANPWSKDRFQSLLEQGMVIKPEMLAAELAATQALEKSADIARQHILFAQKKLNSIPYGRPQLILHKLAANLLEQCERISDYAPAPQDTGYSMQNPGPKICGLEHLPASSGKSRSPGLGIR